MGAKKEEGCEEGKKSAGNNCLVIACRASTWEELEVAVGRVLPAACCCCMKNNG
jgi:hypothetical protein